MQTINDLKPGECGKVIRIGTTGEMHQRIIDMGIIPGVVVKMKRTAPFGDPIQINVRGYELSIGRSEARLINIELVRN